MKSSDLLGLLRHEKNRKGSKARCHLLTHGSRNQVSARLSSLIAPSGNVLPESHCWMPQGFDVPDEPQLGTSDNLIPDEGSRKALVEWWLAVPKRANTPNWDIASTCTVDGKTGLLLIEAKAHDKELLKEDVGKSLKYPVTPNSLSNHDRIGSCIRDANLALAAETKLPWALSRDTNYQMSNRFAWSWKVTELGLPVILVYLGFLRAEEMRRKDQNPLPDDEEWQRLVKSHGEPLVPKEVWNRKWTVHGQPFIPLIKTVYLPLEDNPGGEVV